MSAIQNACFVKEAVSELVNVTLVPGVQMFRMLRPSVLMWLEGQTFVGSLGAGRKLYQGNENTINNYFNVS